MSEPHNSNSPVCPLQSRGVVPLCLAGWPEGRLCTLTACSIYREILGYVEGKNRMLQDIGRINSELAAAKNKCDELTEVVKRLQHADGDLKAPVA